MNIYQLWGLEPIDAEKKEEIAAIVARLLETAPAAIITGQCEDRAFLARLCDMAHAAGARAYQWTPLFAEWDDRAAYEPIRTAAGGALPRSYGSEFNFRCPNSPGNVDLFLRLQDEAMAGVPFDGVFLDRVRYPSFSYGDLSQTACFCENCLDAYRARGVDAEGLRAALCGPEAGALLRPIAAEEGRVLFADRDVQGFFDVRAEAVTRAVERVARHYGARGMCVALDLFPPETAYLVGQDLAALLPLCSFAKPMIYLYTQAPAGYPYEREAFGRATGQLAALEALYGPAPLQGQIRQYEAVAARLGKPLFWGIESVRVPGIAEMTPERIRASRREIAAGGGASFCMSWSLLVMPRENIDAWVRDAAAE